MDLNCFIANERRNEIQDFDSLANLFSFLQLNVQPIRFPALFYINHGNCKANMDLAVNYGENTNHRTHLMPQGRNCLVGEFNDFTDALYIYLYKRCVKSL